MRADNVHNEISELFIAVFKRQFSSRLVKGIVASHFDKTLQEKLPDDLNKTANLTGKLFFFVLSEYLKVNELKKNITLIVYPLPEGYRHDMMKLNDSKLTSVKASLFDTGPITRNYLVKVQMGLGVPSEKIIFISMWKIHSKFFIVPAACVLGNKSFPEAAGQHYNIKSSNFTWDAQKLERFVKFLREIKQIDTLTLKGMLANDFSQKKHLTAHPLICHESGDYPGGTEIIFVKQSNPEQWVHVVFPKNLDAPRNLKKEINLQGYFQGIQNKKTYTNKTVHKKIPDNYKYFVARSWEYQR